MEIFIVLSHKQETSEYEIHKVFHTLAAACTWLQDQPNSWDKILIPNKIWQNQWWFGDYEIAKANID